MTDDPTSKGRAKDDALLDALGETARKEQGETDWEALESWSSGDIDEARAKKRTTVAALPGAAEVFEPWDSSARASLNEKMLALVGRPTPLKAVTRRRTLLAASGILAAAAAVAMLLVPRSDGLPPYALSASAGDQPLRSGEPGPEPAPVLRDGSLLELRMRPTANVERAVGAALLVRGPADRDWVASDRAAEVAATGAVRWRGTAREVLAGRKGAIDVVAVVALAGELPEPAEVARRGPGHHGRWSAATFHITVLSE